MALHIVTYEYPKRIYRGSFEISDKHYQSFLKKSTNELKQSEAIPVYKNT